MGHINEAIPRRIYQYDASKQLWPSFDSDEAHRSMHHT